MKKANTEALVDRGYHLLMMSKIAAKNPSVLSDPQFMDYCKNIEEASDNGVPVQWETEQAEFQKLLAAENINPAEIGYDPHYKTQLQFEKNENGIHFHGGWLDSVLPPAPKDAK